MGNSNHSSNSGRDRREHERFKIFDSLLTGRIEKSKTELISVGVIDISQNGVAFVTSPETELFPINETVSMRIYFQATNSFVPCSVTIMAHEKLPDGRCRHGAQLVKGSMNEGALAYLAEFVKSVTVVTEDQSA